MNNRSIATLVIVLSSIPIAAANAQTVYVAPGGIYVGGGPVYVTPVPPGPGSPYGPAPYAPYVAPPYAPPPPAIVAPAPAYDIPPPVYSDREGFYVAPPYEAYGTRRSTYGTGVRSYGVPADYA